MKFCFPYISSPGDRIFKILVSTPHNTPLIMGDRHKNFEDPITWARDIRKTKFHLVRFFFTHPLSLYCLFFNNTMSVLKRPEGETLSALKLNQKIMFKLHLLLMIICATKRLTTSSSTTKKYI